MSALGPPLCLSVLSLPEVGLLAQSHQASAPYLAWVVAGGLSKQGHPLCPFRLDKTDGEAKKKAMASLVQYTKVGGQLGKSRANGPALWPPWTPDSQPSLSGYRLPSRNRSSASVMRT